MQKHSKLIRAANWKLSFLYQICRFQNRNLWCNFQTLLARKRGLAHPFFLYGNESLRHYLWYYLKRMATFLILEVRFFQGARFFSGPGSRSGSGFSMMSKTMNSFRNFKKRVHKLKWWLFSGNRYTCGITFSNNWIASYVRKKELSFRRKVRRHLSAKSNMGKRNWHMMKGWHMKVCW